MPRLRRSSRISRGSLEKLAAQADDAAKTLINFSIRPRPLQQGLGSFGKKEILSTWETSKVDIMNSPVP